MAAAIMALSSCANLRTRDTVAGGARRASDFELTSETGKTVRLEDLRKQGHVVVVFYRGFW